MINAQEFNFHKRHYLPQSILSAAKLILPIGRRLILSNASFLIKEANHSKNDNSIDAVVEIFSISIKKIKLLSLSCNKNNNSLSPLLMNDGFRESNESVVTLDWIVEFCEKQSKKYLPNFFDAILDSIEKQPGKCYIYRHIFDDGRMYIGKGVGNRLNILSRRNAYYQQTLKEVGPPIIEKICDNISEESAYKIECALIEEFRKQYGFSFILNSTSGMEQAADIGDMPILTIQKIKQYRDINLEDSRFTRKVNIFQRMSPEPGAAKWYYKNISVADAARFLRCTMNEVIKASNEKGSIINNFSFLTDEEIDFEINRR